MKHNHREAFCLMKYASRGGKIVEWIWNSRDGVTPFGISSKPTTDIPMGVTLFHTHWLYDTRILDYKPLEGERVFVDAKDYKHLLIEYFRKELARTLRDKDEIEIEARRIMEAYLNDNPGAPVIINAKDYKHG